MIKKALLALLPFAGPALAEGFSLQNLPIDCDPNSAGCHIQQYVDADPGPGARDYRCRGLSYDGHKGTDFALPTLAEMNRGVAVLATAPGVVAAVRDGMEDTGFNETTAAAITGRECGNGLVLRHDDGWETQYCHLRRNSITVTKGQSVTAGQPLGLVGQSGRAQFPHVHLSVRKDGQPVDPFDPDGNRACAAEVHDTLWTDPPAYTPGGLVDIGFAAAIPTYASVKAGTAAQTDLSADADALVIFAFGYGLREGDVIAFRIAGPEGTVLKHETEIDRTQAQAFRAVGKKQRNAPWAAGRYEGSAILIREGDAVSEMSATLTVRP